MCKYIYECEWEYAYPCAGQSYQLFLFESFQGSGWGRGASVTVAVPEASLVPPLSLSSGVYEGCRTFTVPLARSDAEVRACPAWLTRL